MFSAMSKMLRSAQASHEAIASVNIYSMESIRGALLAAQERNRPIILAFAARYLPNMSLRQAVQLAQSCGEDISIPYALHLDHCGELDVIQDALQEGFSSVMFDGSALPFKENVRKTAQAARMAHHIGASVEAELGAIGTGFNAAEETGNLQIYTSPEQTAEFVNCTDVDALAVSIGTVHGIYKGTPCIRMDILQAIRRATSIPLVLHGGSGTGTELLRETIRNGICKVNINTELSMICVEGILDAIHQEPGIHLSQLNLLQAHLFKEATARYLDIIDTKTAPEAPAQEAIGT